MNEDKPPHQRPELPDFWDLRFRNGVTPWDAGTIAAAFRDHFARLAPARILVPGCGHAHEARYLDDLGWQVVALDFSAAAIEVARDNLEGWGGVLLHEDLFAHRPPQAYDAVYERAFLCALPRKLWPHYGGRMASLVAPGGVLAGYFFLGSELKGPPFAMPREQLDDLLSPWFDLVAEKDVLDSIPVFQGRERWMVWQRRRDTK